MGKCKMKQLDVDVSPPAFVCHKLRQMRLGEIIFLTLMSRFGAIFLHFPLWVMYPIGQYHKGNPLERTECILHAPSRFYPSDNPIEPDISRKSYPLLMHVILFLQIFCQAEQFLAWLVTCQQIPHVALWLHVVFYLMETGVNLSGTNTMSLHGQATQQL